MFLHQLDQPQILQAVLQATTQPTYTLLALSVEASVKEQPALGSTMAIPEPSV